MESLRPPRSFSLAAAFTLIELLTVIAIISILMSLLFPVVNAVKEAGRRAQAKQDVEAIITAVKAYHTDYGKYPSLRVDGTAPSSDEGVGDTTNAGMENDNSVLFDTLRAVSRGVNTDHVKNPRKIRFFEGKSVSNEDQPRGGFVDRGSGNKRGSFFDPWGNQYNVVMDTNYDNQVDLTKYYSDIPSAESPQTGVAAFSLGLDGKLGAAGNKRSRDKDSDDIVSWK